MAFVPFDPPILAATFHARRKRFFADMTLADGSTVVAHCPNTGSMRSCLLPGASALIWDSRNPARKLRHSFKAIRIGEVWVGVDTLLPNRLVARAIREGEFPGFAGYDTIRPEAPMGASSRVDLLLGGPAGYCYVEVKNVTLVEEGLARFPDARTTRGQKHLEELIARVAEGHRAALVFVIQRADGRRFAPADDIDPEYGQWLRQAQRSGVELFALSAEVTPQGVHSRGFVPVHLGL